MLEPGTITDAGDGTLTLAPGTVAPEPGHYLYGAESPTSGAYLVRVTGVTEEADGSLVVQGEDASAQDAFDEFKVSYDGPLSQAGQRRGASVGIKFSDYFSCSWAPEDSNNLLPDIDLYLVDPVVHFDVDVTEGSMDFMLKGALQGTLGMTLRQQVSCTATVPIAEYPLGTTGIAVGLSGKATLGFEVDEPDGQQHTFSSTRTLRAAAGYSVYGGEANDLTAGSVDTTVDTDGVKASLSLGLSAAVKFKLVGGAVAADASAEFGTELALERPPVEDEAPMLGPHCFDANNRLYVKVGAKATFAFFATAGASKTFETDPVGIYRGPCWGYEGTVTFTVTGRAAPGSYSCTYWNGCPGYDWNQKATLTMITTTPARFKYGAYASQLHNWSATNKNVELAEFEPNTCVVGAVDGFDTQSVDQSSLVFHSEGVSAFGTWGSAGLSGSSWHNDTYPVTCGGNRVEYEGAPAVSLTWYYPWGSATHYNRLFAGRPSTPASRPVLQGTVVGSEGGESVATVVYDLKRIEIARPSALGRQ